MFQEKSWAGQIYSVKLEYRRLSGAYFPVLGSINGVQMSWASLAAPDELKKYDAVVVAVGSSGLRAYMKKPPMYRQTHLKPSNNGKVKQIPSWSDDALA